ncbi:hypothetical protein [uncultured Tenacibaculum sp.]|uniref:hypothetical protein n=1 Tax=uncultured Tenacibaculum sp. TaxID=174713 RepID=UPI002604EB4B|nr:hypothetical protein [uncultured Tenacibaculum sp.]
MSFQIFDNIVLNIFAVIIIIIISIILILFVLATILKYIPYLKSTLKVIIEYFYLILIPLPVFYIFIYYSNVVNGELSENFMFEDTLAKALLNLSYIFFSAGIFSSIIKLINTFGFVKNKFTEIVLSDEFDHFFTKKLESLSFSREYLLNHGNLEGLWKKITLLKYENAFPEIHKKLEKQISNHYFSSKSTEFYYSDFKIELDFKLLEDSTTIQIKNTSRYKIMRPNELPFNWDFRYAETKEDHVNNPVNLKFTYYNDEDLIVFDETSAKVDDTSDPALVKVSFEKELKDNKTYPIKTHRIIKQNIDIDRFWNFGCSRIINNLTLSIKSCDKLACYLKPVNQLSFVEEFNEQTGENLYMKHDIILPGEIFIITLTRKN